MRRKHRFKQREVFRVDWNYAYLWFFHEIVGTHYISHKMMFTATRLVNEVTALDRNKTPFAKEFERSDVFATPPFNSAEEDTFAYFDPDDRREEDKKNGVPTIFSSGDSMIGASALGFKTSQTFLPHGMEFSDLTAAQLESASWADVFLYRGDDVVVSKLTTQNYS